MTPLPPPLGRGEVIFWRLDQARHAATWDSGTGSHAFGGRWNSRGRRVVYAALDPATAILEVAVHKGFSALDTVPHILTSAIATETGRIHVVMPTDVPNDHWLRPSAPSAGQQAFGDGLLDCHEMILVPSLVSKHSWNVVFSATARTPCCKLMAQEPFALDTRLHPPASA